MALGLFGLSYVNAVNANVKTRSLECFDNTYLVVSMDDLKPATIRISGKEGIFEYSARGLSGSTYINKTTFEILTLAEDKKSGIISALFYDTGLAFEQNNPTKIVGCHDRAL